jgi:hypothetical protein
MGSVLEHLHAQYIQCKKKKSWSPLPNLFHRVTGQTQNLWHFTRIHTFFVNQYRSLH